MKYSRWRRFWIARNTPYSAIDMMIRKVPCIGESVGPGDETREVGKHETQHCDGDDHREECVRALQVVGLLVEA